jgi:hypothetical protein
VETVLKLDASNMMTRLPIVYPQSNWTASKRGWTKSMLTCEKQKRTSLAWRNAVDYVYYLATSKSLSGCYPAGRLFPI